MTTLTLNQPINLRKRHFNDLVELRDYIDRELETNVGIDFRPLKRNEITPALQRKMRETKKLPHSRFTNLTRRHANR